MNKELKFDVKYFKCNVTTNYVQEVSHSYTETWNHVDIYCPGCGQKDVWVTSGEDYYHGAQHICMGCKKTFHLPHGLNMTTSVQDKQRVENLDELIALHFTTERREAERRKSENEK